MLAEAPARPIAGGTDLMVALTGELGEPPARLVDLWRLDELRGIGLDGDAIVLGALTTYTDIRRSAVCREHLPGLVEAAATIGAAQIQNPGTPPRRPSPPNSPRSTTSARPPSTGALSPRASCTGPSARRAAGERQ